MDDIKSLIYDLSGEIVDDIVLNFMISKSIKVIINYLNNPRLTNEYIIEEYIEAIVTMIINSLSIDSHKGVSSITQGDRAVSYTSEKSFTITDEIKQLLPVPSIRMFK